MPGRPNTSLAEARHDQHSGFGHFFDGGFYAFTALTAIFDAAIGHGVQTPGRRVPDDQGANFQLSVRSQDAAGVAGQQTRLQSVFGVIDVCQGLLEVVVRFDKDYGAEGFLISNLLFDPGSAVSIDDANIVFDFAGGADPLAFLESGEFNLDAFLKSSDGGAFSSEFGLGNVFVDDAFLYETPDGSIVDLALDGATGDLSAAATETPEPSTAWLLLLGIGALAIQMRRRHARMLLKQ